jgi:hypothetical protein
MAGLFFSIFTSAFCYPDRRQAEEQQTAENRWRSTGNKARCSVTGMLLLVTTVFSGSETHRAISSRPLGIDSIFSQGVLVSQKLRAPTPFSRVK